MCVCVSVLYMPYYDLAWVHYPYVQLIVNEHIAQFMKKKSSKLKYVYFRPMGNIHCISSDFSIDAMCFKFQILHFIVWVCMALSSEKRTKWLKSVICIFSFIYVYVNYVVCTLKKEIACVQYMYVNICGNGYLPALQ